MKSILKGTSIYSISDLLIKAGSVLMLPVFTSLLSPDQYGIVGLLTPISSFIPFFFSFGLYIYQPKEYTALHDKLGRDSLIFSINTFLIILNSLILIIIFLPPINSLVRLLLDSSSIRFYPHVSLTLLTGFLGVFVLLADNYIQIKQNYKKKAIGALSSFLLNLITSFVLIYFFNFEATGKLIGNFIGNLFLIFYFYIDYFGSIARYKFNKTFLLSGLSIGIPAMFNLVIGYINNYIDRIFIARFLTMADVGIYSIAYTGSFVLSTLINGFMNTWRPIYYQLENNNKTDDHQKRVLINNTLINAAAVIALICLIGELFQKELITILLPNEYIQITMYLPILLFGVFFNLYYLFFADIHVFQNTYKFVPFLMFLGAGINIVINVLFLREYGVIVAAYSTVISNLFMALSMVISLEVMHKYRLNYIKHLILIILLFNPFVIYISIYKDIGLVNFIAKLLYLLVFVLIILKIMNKKLKNRFFIQKGEKNER